MTFHADLSRVLVYPLVVATVLGADAYDPTPQFRISTKHNDDTVAVKSDKSKVVFSIASPTGISHATITRTTETWPESVVLRLNLKGMESFQATNGKLTLAASVSSHDDNNRIRVWMEGKGNMPLAEGDPFWIKIRIIDENEKPVTLIPLKSGCFEITLPQAFLDDNPKLVKIHWIDFYR